MRLTLPLTPSPRPCLPQFTAKCRYNKARFDLPINDALEATVASTLEDIQAGMLAKARAERDAHLVPVTEWDDFVPTLDGRNMVLAPWCETTPCEENVKELTSAAARKEEEEDAGADESKNESTGTTGEGGGAPALSGSAKTLCIPFNQAPLPAGTKCFCKGCDRLAVGWTLWGRSY